MDDPQSDPGKMLTRAELEGKPLTLGLYGNAAAQDELKHCVASV